MEKICKTCGTTTTTKWYGSGTMCRQCYRKSSDEYIKAKRESYSLRCEHCGKVFNKITTLSRSKKIKFCSIGCSHNSKHKPNVVINRCKQCNKEFTSNRHIEFCNKACYSKFFKQTHKLLSLEEKIKHRLRSRLWQAIANNTKSGSAVKDLGCSIDFLKSHLESLFIPGMTWENYGHKGWHIDHIVPISSFNLSDPEQLKQACRYTNLQPLWWFDNLSKGSKVE